MVLNFLDGTLLGPINGVLKVVGWELGDVGWSAHKLCSETELDSSEFGVRHGGKFVEAELVGEVSGVDLGNGGVGLGEDFESVSIFWATVGGVVGLLPAGIEVLEGLVVDLGESEFGFSWEVAEDHVRDGKSAKDCNREGCSGLDSG